MKHSVRVHLKKRGGYSHIWQHTNMSFACPCVWMHIWSLSMCIRPKITISSLWAWLPHSSVTGNYPLYASQFHLIQYNFLNIFPSTVESCNQRAAERTADQLCDSRRWELLLTESMLFPTVTFLQNNFPIMTASSRVLCKRVSHFSLLCTGVSGGVKSGKIFFLR